MTKAKLIEAMEKYPDDMDVFFISVNNEFDYNSVESVRKETIKFSEGTKSRVNAVAEVLVLSD